VRCGSVELLLGENTIFTLTDAATWSVLSPHAWVKQSIVAVNSATQRLNNTIKPTGHAAANQA